jgi:transmembrane 9 superfamily protein 3
MAPALSAPPQYAPGDPVTLWVNKVGPYNNPQQVGAGGGGVGDGSPERAGRPALVSSLPKTFHYDTLPLCRPPTPGKPATRWGGLGEALGGDALVDGGLPLAFRVPVPPTPVCDQVLTAGDAAALTHAVTRHYWYEMFADDLPVWGFVGPPPAGGRDAGAPPADPGAPVHVYTHKAFHVAANGDRVIQVNLTNENPVAVAPGAALSLTYSVDWTDTDTPFGRRFDKYLDASFFEHQARRGGAWQEFFFPSSVSLDPPRSTPTFST